MRTFLLLLFISLVLVSCDQSIIFQETYQIDQPWKYEDIATFSFASPDTTEYYDLLLTINHSNDFGYENAYTKILTSFPSGKNTEDIVSLELANNYGSWNGDCNRNCELILGLKERFRFQEIGDYEIGLQNYSREELSGIQSLKLIIQKAQPSK